MKVIRCKDCVLYGGIECPMVCEKPSPMFFCGNAKPSEDYKPTKGDNIRNMTNRQLAVWLNGQERDAYRSGKNGGECMLGETNINFYIGFFGSPEGEDYNG